jgi:hypothetical protein
MAYGLGELLAALEELLFRMRPRVGPLLETIFFIFNINISGI